MPLGGLRSYAARRPINLCCFDAFEIMLLEAEVCNSKEDKSSCIMKIFQESLCNTCEYFLATDFIHCIKLENVKM